MFSNEEQATAYVDSLIAQAQENAVQARKMSAEMDALAVQGTSEDRLVTVTVNHHGAVSDVEFHDVPSPARLRQSFMEANREAQTRLATKVAELAKQHYGEGSDLATEFSNQYAAQFGTTPDGDGPARQGR